MEGYARLKAIAYKNGGGAMSTKIVREVVGKFVQSPEPKVLVVKGQWGVGKTHMWWKLIDEFRSKIALKKYSYVSLFGINSLSELRLAIVAKTQYLEDSEKSGDDVDGPKEKMIRAMKRLIPEKSISWIHDVLPDAKKNSIVGQVTVGLETLAPMFLSKTLICFDDFERLSDDFSPILLGYISELKEEKDCKVVLIMNDQQLGPKRGSYETYREKVVDLELAYAPTPEEAAAIIFTDDSPLFRQVKERAIELKIINIRLLRKIHGAVTMINEQLGGMHPDVIRQVVHSTVLFIRCSYERNDDTPPIEFLRDFNSIRSSMVRARARREGVVAHENEDPRHQQWEGLLSGYGFTEMDEFDRAIVDVVEKGFSEGTSLLAAAEKADEMCRARELDASFTNAWNLFHNTLANNENELVQGLNEAFRRCVATISPLNLNGTVKLLRELEQDTVADELIDFYIEYHGRDHQRFDLDGYPFSNDITDAEVIRKFKAKHEQEYPVPSLREAIAAASGTHWSQADGRALNAASEADLLNFLHEEHGENLRRFIQGCQRFGGTPGNDEFGLKFRRVLEAIAAETPLNGIRIGRYLR